MQKNSKQKSTQGLPLYTPFKMLLEQRGVDEATAGQTAWLFVSFVIAGAFGLILSFLILPSYNFIMTLKNYNDLLLVRALFFTIIFHFLIVMLRLKYFIVNLLFLGILYVGYIILDLENVYLLICIGLSLFIIYMLIPIYSWRIKILDGIVYFLYAIDGWFVIHLYMR